MNSAAALAKVTGSTRVTVVRETRHLDGTLTTDSVEHNVEHAVKYVGGGQWRVSRENDTVGLLVQGSIGEWRAYDNDGRRLTIKGYDVYGGPERTYEIANKMVAW